MLLMVAFAVVTFVLPVSTVEARTCFRCGGSGSIEKYEGDYRRYGQVVRGRGSYRETCPDCHGSGQKD